ncbi:MAG: PhzF family phenazine biosynthesis protein [Balneola sp.]|nr:PhzF family phenazine biosynthesis protein [Balneola sp.]MBO6650036.1 PhzF family phenazine biosynthesis protein [Balneola sp.]MBO6711614.1 PhzF family phenazine biosynthesis protein [Balneola sp.]MBO6799810.1 PhzF family phenazine biosynthesis protein [Balneola sp.]MBO6870749.1 PhzF family phenazine biosynthesis protein [Balneola sp.]
MKVPIFQVDAFTDRIFGGNPAAVCPLEEWLDEETMQHLAQENNLSETAFFVKNGDEYDLRWFTPEVEVDLCGHATLATAHVLFEHLGYDKDEIRFQTKSGLLTVKKEGERLMMDFPTDDMPQVDPPAVLFQALGIRSDHVFFTDDYMVVLDSEEDVQNIDPDFRLLSEVNARGVIVTAPGNEVDFVSRFFAPGAGIDEDPATGSAHTKLTPYWSRKLGKDILEARQISKRVGELTCRNKGDRTEILGNAVTYLIGEINI